MALNIKNKIWLGTSFLFLLLLITGGVGIFYMAKLKKDARNILVDNYESVAYGHTMQQQLINLPLNNSSASEFEKALKLQEANITEPDEGVVTANVRKHFEKLKEQDSSRNNIASLHSNIQKILAVNMQAIQRKNLTAEKTAQEAFTLIIMLATFVFIIGLTFLVNFPSVVTRPINEFSTAIKEIAAKNYKHRVRLTNKDEFGKLAASFNEMADRLEYFESSNLNQLLFEKSRAEAVINSLKDASIGIDKNNIILFANSQALQLLGLTKDDMIGRNVNDVSSKNELFKFLIDNQSSVPFKIVVDNRENYFVKEIVEVVQGGVNNKVLVLKNITSFKELDVAKTNFIATISHELKTPLASSDFSLRLLEDQRVSSLTKDQKELIKNLKQDNSRMLKILSELLNMSQVEAGQIRLDLKEVAPADIITAAIETAHSLSNEKNIALETLTQGPLNNIKADADKTTWVLNNFLSNAIKYSFTNSAIEILVTQDASGTTFSVKDFGPGIAQEYLPRIFERYFQVPGSKEKGSGLGLAISKEFIEAQGGQVWVKSEIGKGSCFSFRLPVNV